MHGMDWKTSSGDLVVSRRLILKRLGGGEVMVALDEGGIARAKERIAEIVAESGIDVDTAGGEV